jgi:hypothetical protein
VQITVEAEGSDVLARLETLAGVESVVSQGAPAGGRVRARVTAAAERDLRPEVYRLAQEAGWTLYELHLEAGSLEDLFRQLTVTGEAV